MNWVGKRTSMTSSVVPLVRVLLSLVQLDPYVRIHGLAWPPELPGTSFPVSIEDLRDSGGIL